MAGIPGTGTKVNGRQSVTVGGVTNSVWIDMRGGDDVVELLVPDPNRKNTSSWRSRPQARRSAGQVKPRRRAGGVFLAFFLGSVVRLQRLCRRNRLGTA